VRTSLSSLSLSFCLVLVFVFGGVAGKGVLPEKERSEWLVLEGKREGATAQRGLFGWGEVEEEGEPSRTSLDFPLVPRNGERSEPH
jgi:hypothetical protein